MINLKARILLGIMGMSMAISGMGQAAVVGWNDIRSISEVKAETFKAVAPSGMVVSNGIMYFSDPDSGLYSDDEKRVIDLVVNTFGMYGGKVFADSMAVSYLLSAVA